MKNTVAVIFCIIISSSSFSQKEKQGSVIEKYVRNGAYKYHYTQQQWMDYIDSALAVDSTIALLWHHKALPYWKTRKYALAVACYDKAVQYDRRRYLGRRGFLKCVFQKDYEGAIPDMEAAMKEFGYGYENGHSYPFYIALCHLQLGRFEKAREVLQADFDKITVEQGEDAIGYLERFYMGIIYYELRNYDRGILWFNLSMQKYERFSDAKYYKALCLYQEGDIPLAKEMATIAKADYDKGYSFAEDSSFYEPDAYKVNWNMAKWIFRSPEEN
jgi:tetratricopeptide (TPR) repeat protein